MTLADIRGLCPDLMTFGRARYLQANGRVRRNADGSLRAQVEDATGLYNVSARLDERGAELASWRCSCERRAARQSLCSHAAALLIDIAGEYASKGYTSGAEALLARFDPPPAKEECLRLQAEIRVLDGQIALGIRAGAKRLYVVKDLLQFQRAMEKELPLRFGAATAIDPSAQAVRRKDQALMGLLREAINEYMLYSPSQRPLRELPLSQSRLSALFSIVAGRSYVLSIDGERRIMRGVRQGGFPARFSLRREGEDIRLACDLPKDLLLLTKDASYIYAAGEVYQLPPEAAQALLPFCEAVHSAYRFAGAQGAMLLSEVLPRLRRGFPAEVEESLVQRLREHPLKARVRLDIQGEELIARVGFGYGKRMIDPFSPKGASSDDAIYLRDPFGEREVLDTLSRYGFRVRAGCAYLRDSARLYPFLLDGIAELQKAAEVLASKRLLAIRPRRTKPKGRLSLVGGRLRFDLELQQIPAGDHSAILFALLDKQRYVRLADGAFLTLEGEDGWDALGESLREAGGEVREDALWMDSTRTAWLDAALSHAGAQVARDEAVLAIAKALSSPPKHALPVKGLRPYQRAGFDWLCTLAELGMGGILADEMGLGKTLQALSLIQYSKKQNGGQKPGREKPSLVVAPTSLLYNWLKEVKKFTPGLKAIALRGDALQRRESAGAKCDVMITTYAQLRRDIEFLSEIEFRYVFLDEAQHVKNPSSLSSESARRLLAEARFALTGTPMENHIGELWSLFDFVLPGYLGELAPFLRRYGEGRATEGLSAKIQPFLLRRLKQDVLPELPEKLESRLIAEMPKSQSEVYYAELQAAQQGLRERFLQQEGSRSNFQILAALTRLRQICCHPSLIYPSYEGESGKLDLLMEVLIQTADGGHRALVFSQFTGMMALIARQLEEKGLSYFYLDGSTPPLNRLEMVDRFNAGERDVFLISLRAGGSGLNLTGADVVVHYDPWWNPAVEDQATDRAHRIGQERPVQVIRLMARDTIEEKIFDLKERKQRDIERVVTPGESLGGGMTAKELLELFDVR